MVEPAICQRGFASVLAANAKSALDRVEYENRLERRERTQQIITRVLRHNIRNNLNTITGYAGMLEAELPGEQTMRARSIIESANELLETSTNTRHISRYTANTDTKNRDLAPVVEESIRTFREEFPSVDVERDVESPCRAKLCEGFSLAVDNILENAVKHNDSSEPWISVRLTCTEQPQLMIEDNGPGIPENELKPLQTGEEEPLQHLSGTGLWLVKLLVENADGDITFEETETGTRVTVTLEPPLSVDGVNR